MDAALGSISSHRDSLSTKMDPYVIPESKEQRIDEVSITPGKLVFMDAYDGKAFKQSFTVLNCGKYPAFAFKMKSIPRGKKLSAGMSIIRSISYLHTSAMALPKASILIYINNKRLVYQIEVYLNAPFVNIQPRAIDFGETDIGTVSRKKYFNLYNTGRKVTQFAIDLGRADLEVIVQPMKGVLEPNETIRIYVEVMGSKVGPFAKEIWIKTEPPRRVKLVGTFIQPKLVVEHPLSTFRLALLDFPKTYYGAEISKTMVIKNRSSTARMFCVVLETKLGLLSIKKEMKTNENLKCFTINPREGRLGAQQKYILRFTFAPKKSKMFELKPYKNYSLVFLRIVNIHYRDVTGDDDRMKAYRTVAELDSQSTESLQSQQTYQAEDPLSKDYVHIYLYGEMEQASVKLVPESFSISYLKLNNTYNYELNIKNMSINLPIIFLYNKIASIEVEPKQMLLGPSCSTEVVVIITPRRIGPVEVIIKFDLIYEGENRRYKVGVANVPLRYTSSKVTPLTMPRFNWGITPRTSNEVGFLVDDVRFNSPVEKSAQAIVDKNFHNFNKDNDNFIAFPNDRPKCLRLWRNKVPCETIYAKLPRLVNNSDEYTFNSAEQDMKKYVKQFYVDYIRSGANVRKTKQLVSNHVPHYDTVKENRILLEEMYIRDYSSETSTSEIAPRSRTALAPEKLMKIKITPKYVDLGKLAPYTTTTESFHIQNNNNFNIQVSIKAFSNTITIKGKERIIVKSRSTRSIAFDCCSHGTGKYNVPVYIIVNQAHIFDTTVSAIVVPTTVMCLVDEIVISPNSLKKYFKLFNPVNCDIAFSWELQDPNFEVFPMSGKIEPRKSLYCRMTFRPTADAIYNTEVYLTSQSGSKQIIKVYCENTRAEIGFHTSPVKFQNIPLNMVVCRDLILRNFSDGRIAYSILNPNPLKEITVTPSSGKIPPKSDLCFKLTARFTDIVEFQCSIDILVQNEYHYGVNVEGNVVFPDISIEPEFIHIHKIISGAFERRAFRITNLSQAQSLIQFSLEDFPEIFIADYNRNIIDYPISLSPSESLELFLEFQPTEPVVYSIYLPYILNGIIGPPALNDPQTVNPNTYFSTTNDGTKTAVKLPETLPIIGVKCASGAPWVKFSSLQFNFSYSGERIKYFTVRNICCTVHKLAIPLVDNNCQFRIHVEKGISCEVNEEYYMASIEPGDDVVFNIEFKPDDYGSYCTQLPIYVNKSIKKQPFNYLNLTGVYLKPSIVCDRKVLYFQTIPLKECTSGTVSLKFVAHRENCVFNSQVFNDSLSVEFTEESIIDRDNTKVTAVITFTPKSEGYIESHIAFNCTCNVSCKLNVRVSAGDSRFESYETYSKYEAALHSMEFKSTFPYYPRPSDDTYYAVKMRLIKKHMEEGLYSQRFYYKHFLRIPEGVCTVPHDIRSKGKEKKLGDKWTPPLLPLLQVLVHLVSQDIIKLVDDGTIRPAFDGLEGTIYLYTIYRNILLFLKQYNVVVSQIEPEYLLPYKLYVIYKKHICHADAETNDSNTLSEDDFYYFATQCWIDLFLRIQKVLVFDRIMSCPRFDEQKCLYSHDVFYTEFLEYYFETKNEFVDRYDNEVKLLLWIEFHYERQKSVLWDIDHYPHLKNPRKFRFFGRDLADGLAFATLIVAYCPYLKDELKTFYPISDSNEQIFHNSCLIYETVNKLNLTYNLLSPNLAFPPTAEMMMVMCYLFDVLPGFYPIQTIVLRSALGQETEHEIVIKNDDNFTIAFTAIFFSNEWNEFSVNQDVIVISAKKEKVLRITYCAKKVVKRYAVLVLSGETYSYKPAKSITLNLHGIPKIFDFSEEFKFNVETFALQTRGIKIHSPFKKSYEARLFFYLGDQEEEPETLDRFLPVSFLSTQSIPRELNVNAECIFNNHGTTVITLNMCFVSVGEFSYFLYFVNDEVGDFCVKLQITSGFSKKGFVDIDVCLPLNFSTDSRCSCNKSLPPVHKCGSYVKYECSKVIILDIPYRNVELIDALRLMFSVSVRNSEYNFWNNLLEYPKGFHILRNHLRNFIDDALQPFKNVLNPSVVYQVEFSKAKVDHAKYIIFDNVTLDGVCKFPIHWNSSDYPEKEIIRLVADHGEEVRQYRIFVMQKYLEFVENDMFADSSRRSSLTSENYVPAEETEDSRHPTVVDDVRIIPPVMIFRDAYDGKVFKQSFSVMNCGKYPAFIRILAASSKAFKLKTIPKGHSISAGLSIVRKISYTHTSAMALPRASLWIYINDKPVMYQLEVHLISPHVTLHPRSLDFGEVDAGTASDPMSIHLCNEGHKIANFVVDLRRSSLELIVEPMKGIIRPLEDVEIKVEVLGSKLGYFTKEIWIKTHPLQRVTISGTFIRSRLVIERPISTFKFTLLDFPRVYLGAEVTRTLVIRNNSSSSTMFCVVSECETGFEFLKVAMEKSEDLKCFNIVPKEGRLQPRQTHILQFTFAPKSAKHFPQMFSIAFVRVMKVHYRDRIVVDSGTDLFAKPSMQVFQEFYMEDDDVEGLDEMNDDYLRVCLYGEIEEARLKLNPESFSIAYLRPNVKYSYELNIKNMSQHLPITFQYNKATCVEVEPKKVTLGPNSSVEVLLSIKPTKIGEAHITVVFDLIYEGKQERCKVGITSLPINYVATMACPYIEPMFNMGITPRITNEVGFLVDDIRFNNVIDKPIQAIVDKRHTCFNKSNYDIIAFPNDRPKTLRPWKSDVPCRTIYAHMPRYVNKQDEYTLTNVETDLKKYTKQQYVDFIRSEARKRQERVPPQRLLPHYLIDKGKRILMEGVYFGDCSEEKSVSELYGYIGVPLPPERLLNVNVKPKMVGLGKIAPYTVCTDSFSIENNNEFPIRVSVKALNNSVVVKGKKMMTIGARTTKNILFDCWSYGLGKYYVPVYVIVNDCHVFDATVVAKVVPTTVVCPNEVIVINPKYNMTFFEIFNPVNCDISFSWEVQDDNYDIYPLSGTIPSRRSLYCRLTFLPKIEAVYKTEIYLLSQNGAKQIINVIIENNRAQVQFDCNSLEFDDIPLNIPITRELILRNFSDTEVVYIITNPNPVDEISITPSKGKVNPRADTFFEIVAHFRNIVKFHCQVQFLLQDEYSYNIDIKGNVVFPDIHIEPESIQIPKIISGAFRRRAFQLVNISNAQNYINFCLEDFPELCITDIDKNVIVDDINLEPRESKQLFLEFRPTEATAYSMFLPFIINGIIGPPAMNDPKSIEPQSYFEENIDEFHIPIKLPESLPLIRLRCAAGEPWAKMSTLNIDFHCNDQRIRHLAITNISSVCHEVTIPLLDENCPFDYMRERSHFCEISNKYCKLLIEPKEEVVIDFMFKPTEFGVYKFELPMFVDKYMDKCPFNYIYLSGTYAKPTIDCNKTILFFQIISTRDQVSENLYLELTNHEKNCIMDTEILHEAFSLKFLETTETPEATETVSFKTRLDFTVSFASNVECFVDSKIIFTCSCGSTFTLIVKAAVDNCFFGSYESFIKIKAHIFSQPFESTFPYFPSSSIESYYGSKMNLMLVDLENWMYSQTFFYKNFFKIPDGISRVPTDISYGSPKQKKFFGKAPRPQLPLQKVLINLMGSGIVKHFNDSSLNPAIEGVEGAIYIYSLYRNILNFLKTQNVFIPQLEPQYLMTYKLYVVFKERVDDSVEHPQKSANRKTLTKGEFLSISTQCWLDLILRIYKKFVFDRSVDFVTPTIHNKPFSRKGDIYRHSFMRYFSEHRHELSDRYELEAKLLIWLQFHFEKQKSVLWNLEIHKHLQQPKLFKSFEIDLWDGLAFATLIAAYCPYMNKFLQNIYPSFENEEQMFHNFCLIHHVMRQINLSYLLTPPHLVKPSTAEMIMTVAYLYDVLPGLFPAETISLEASLGDTSSHEIVLKNTGNVMIAYTPIFFNNNTNDFEVNSECVIIAPKQRVVLKVTYIAKSILKKTSILLLSGETVGFKYATSMAIILVGNPKTFDFTDEYSFKVNTYAYVSKKLNIYSPFEKEYKAKMYLYFGDGTKLPETIDDFVSVAHFVEHNIPREMCANPECKFNSGGMTTLDIKFCFVSCSEYSFFIYFVNEDVGDFCVKVTILAQMDKNNVVDIDVDIPMYFSQDIVCSCNPEWVTSDGCKCYHLSSDCPKMIPIKIPCLNAKLIQALRMMLKASVVPSEFEFWDALLDAPKGFHVFRNYLSNSFGNTFMQFKNVLNPNVTYRVEMTNRKINYMKNITIADVTSRGVFEMAIHWNGREEPTQEIMKLYADHNQEIRQYRLNFRRPNNTM